MTVYIIISLRTCITHILMLFLTLFRALCKETIRSKTFLLQGAHYMES